MEKETAISSKHNKSLGVGVPPPEGFIYASKQVYLAVLGAVACKNCCKMLIVSAKMAFTSDNISVKVGLSVEFASIHLSPNNLSLWGVCEGNSGLSLLATLFNT